VSDISTTSLAAAGERLRVGSVLSRSIEIYLRNFPKCLAVGAIIGLPQLVSAIYVFDLSRMARTSHGGVVYLFEMGFLLLWVLTFALGQSTMIYGAFQDIRGLNSTSVPPSPGAFAGSFLSSGHRSTPSSS
jgi:hypothetical protein